MMSDYCLLMKKEAIKTLEQAAKYDCLCSGDPVKRGVGCLE